MTAPDPAGAGRRLVSRVGGGAADFARGVAGGVRWPEHRVRAVQRRTLWTLVVTQSLGGLGSTIGIAVAALLAVQISGRTALGGLAQTCQVLGAAVGAFVLAHLMGRWGRRRGLLLGYLIGAAGAGLCVVAGAVGSFGTLLVGACLLGATTAANGLSRYAATDLAAPRRRARALSTVMWATTVGAVAGPNLTGVAGRLAHRLDLPRLTGPFLVALVGMVLAGAVIAFFLRPDPLLVAREAALGGRPVGRPSGTNWARVLRVAREHPGVAAGAAGLALGHAVMVSVMVMTPVHMSEGHAGLELIGIVISVHVLGMYAFSPVVGWAADRFGRPSVLMAGSVVLLVALLLAGTSPMGASWRIGIGLFLLGLGWSLCTVSASALLSESAPAAVRTDVQGAADLVMGLVAAAAGALAGLIVGVLDYAALALFAGLLAAGVATAGELARRTTRPAGPVEGEPAT